MRDNDDDLGGWCAKFSTQLLLLLLYETPRHYKTPCEIENVHDLHGIPANYKKQMPSELF